MLTPDVHPPHDGEPAAVLHDAHHNHGPLGPDDFNAKSTIARALTPAQIATCRECGAIIKETPA